MEVFLFSSEVGMRTRRKFSREYKLEAIRLVTERGVSITKMARDLGLHLNTLRKWLQDHAADPQHAFPWEGQLNDAVAARGGDAAHGA